MTGRVAFLLSFFLVLLGSACSRQDRVIEIDDRFSINIARVPYWFPGEGEDRLPMTATEDAVLREKGPPDFIRFWWRPDGSFITTSDLSGKQDVVGDMMGRIKKTWIYRREELEIEFLDAGGFLEHPMTEKLKLVCDYGDPSFKTGPKPNRYGQMKETWNWMDHGLILEFIDDVEVSRRHYEGTGEGTFLGH